MAEKVVKSSSSGSVDHQQTGLSVTSAYTHQARQGGGHHRSGSNLSGMIPRAGSPDMRNNNENNNTNDNDDNTANDGAALKEEPKMKGNKVPYNVVALAPNYVVDQLVSRVAGNVAIVKSAKPGEAFAKKAKMKSLVSATEKVSRKGSQKSLLNNNNDNNEADNNDDSKNGHQLNADRGGSSSNKQDSTGTSARKQDQDTVPGDVVRTDSTADVTEENNNNNHKKEEEHHTNPLDERAASPLKPGAKAAAKKAKKEKKAKAEEGKVLTVHKAHTLASPSVFNHFYKPNGDAKPKVFENLITHGKADVPENKNLFSVNSFTRSGVSSVSKRVETNVSSGAALNDSTNPEGEASKMINTMGAMKTLQTVSTNAERRSSNHSDSNNNGTGDPNNARNRSRASNAEGDLNATGSLTKSKLWTSPDDTKDPKPTKVFENEYIKHQMLGRGSFGETWMVEWVGVPGPDGEEPIIPSAYSALACTKPTIKLADGKSIPAEHGFVAKIEAKSMAKKKGQGGNAAGAEERILGNCAHPCVVAYVEEFDDKQYHYLIMEYVDGGDLRQEVQRRSEGENVKHFSEASLLFLFVQIVMAVEYLHRYNVLHRDLKTANVLLSKKWLVKLADFGFAKQYDFQDVDHNVSTTALGTPYYMAPELFKRETYSDKAEAWSLGCILYELITLRRPFDGDSVQDLAHAVMYEEYADLQRDNISDELVALLDALLDKDPAERPSCKQVLQSAIMRNAMEEFIGKFTRAANASNSSALDKSWIKVLQEHQKILLADSLSSPKSRQAMSRMRSVAMSSRMMSAASRGGASSRAESSEDDSDDSD